MAAVIGVGGVFFKSPNPKATIEWYTRVLGMSFAEFGAVIFTPDVAAKQPGAATVFSPFPTGTDYFEPSTKEFMFNLMVDDLSGILAQCKTHGVEPVQVYNDQPNGRFAHIMDPDGRKIELWEPAPMAG